jgi:hypothetical protein
LAGDNEVCLTPLSSLYAALRKLIYLLFRHLMQYGIVLMPLLFCRPNPDCVQKPSSLLFSLPLLFQHDPYLPSFPRALASDISAHFQGSPCPGSTFVICRHGPGELWHCYGENSFSAVLSQFKLKHPALEFEKRSFFVRFCKRCIPFSLRASCVAHLTCLRPNHLDLLHSCFLPHAFFTSSLISDGKI